MTENVQPVEPESEKSKTTIGRCRQWSGMVKIQYFQWNFPSMVTVHDITPWSTLDKVLQDTNVIGINMLLPIPIVRLVENIPVPDKWKPYTLLKIHIQHGAWNIKMYKTISDIGWTLLICMLRELSSIVAHTQRLYSHKSIQNNSSSRGDSCVFGLLWRWRWVMLLLFVGCCLVMMVLQIYFVHRFHRGDDMIWQTILARHIPTPICFAYVHIFPVLIW